jgi:hypothetical protein
VAVLVVITAFTMCVLASLGLFMSGVAALRQARISKRMFQLRYPAEGRDTSSDPESTFPKKASNSHE